jgi:2-dehydropantoate 2-reductase
VGVASAAGLEAFRTGRVPAAAPRPCLTTDQLLADPDWENIVRRLMEEIVRAAQGIGLPVADDVPDLQIKRTRTMGAYKPSTLIDYERGQPIELQSLFLEPLRLANSVGVPAPTLERLCTILRALALG